MDTFNLPQNDRAEQQRWYIAVTARRDPDQLVRQIFELVPRFNLKDFLTRICYERGAANEREFYLFLGVTSFEKGAIPLNYQRGFEALLKQLHLLDQGLYLAYEEIDPMASDEIEGQNFRQIRMPETNQMVTVTDPFSFTDYNPAYTNNHTEQHNRLLRWMSAVGSASWDLYKNTCAALDLAENSSKPSRIMRRLQALGHTEMFASGRKWIMCPPCLVVLERSSEDIVCFLSGKRSEALIDALEKRMGIVDRTIQPQGGAPDRIRVMFQSEKALLQAIDEIEREGLSKFEFIENASLQLALALPPILEWTDDLTRLDSLVRSAYEYRIWDQTSREFVSMTKIPDETGFYELTRITEANHAPVFNAFFDAERNTWFRGDWYGLRFLSLIYSDEFQPVAYYSADERKIAIHRDERWPGIYERALILASGLLPFRDKEDWLYFENIPLDVAHLLTNKLNVELTQE